MFCGHKQVIALSHTETNAWCTDDIFNVVLRISCLMNRFTIRNDNSYLTSDLLFENAFVIF